jgi:hypothetical protein
MSSGMPDGTPPGAGAAVDAETIASITRSSTPAFLSATSAWTEVSNAGARVFRHLEDVAVPERILSGRDAARQDHRQSEGGAAAPCGPAE